MTDDELDDPKNMKCIKCGHTGLPVLVIINMEWMCADCIAEKINALLSLVGSLNNISDIINCTDYSMSKYKKIKEIIKKIKTTGP